MSFLKQYLSIFMCAEYYVYMYCYLFNNLCVVKYNTSFFKNKVEFGEVNKGLLTHIIWKESKILTL